MYLKLIKKHYKHDECLFIFWFKTLFLDIQSSMHYQLMCNFSSNKSVAQTKV